MKVYTNELLKTELTKEQLAKLAKLGRFTSKSKEVINKDGTDRDSEDTE